MAQEARVDPEDWQARAEQAEQALEEALAERNRLWEQLQQREARDQELADARATIALMRESASWKATAPLRILRGIFHHRHRFASRARKKLREFRTYSD